TGSDHRRASLPIASRSISTKRQTKVNPRKIFNKIIPFVALLSLLGSASCSKEAAVKKGGEAKPSPAQGQQMKSGGEMKGMAGMAGMKEGEMKAGEKPSEFVVPVERQQQIGVTYAKVE